jgi:3-phosphoshikimate 1-carboxyvinyltransferase
MAMAFAPLATQANVNIEHPQVVNKSYPSFWEDLKRAGINIKEEYQ